MEYVRFQLQPLFWILFNFIPRRDKKFYRPATIKRWVVVIYERQARFKPDLATEMVQSFIQGAQSVGMTVEDKAPLIFWRDPFQEVAGVSSVIKLFCYLHNPLWSYTYHECSI